MKAKSQDPAEAGVADALAFAAPTGPADAPRVVGIGASAGGMRALQAFLGGLPERTGLAFAVVVHLDPDHESTLAERLQPHTPMPCVQVTGRVELCPDHVYVIPPGLELTVENGHLDVGAFDEPLGRRGSIDLFLRALADAHPDAFAVILSGAGADGTSGLKRLKERGGFVLAQSPDEAEFDAMPRSAIATGLVNVVLPAAELAAKLADLAGAAFPALGRPNGALGPADDEALRRILALLRVRTGHDFGDYKRTTVLRRIARRLQVHGLATLAAYADLVRERPDEAAALLQDLLISVTNFFRDPDAFEALERDVIPGLFEGKAPGESVRVWSAGCATGEEAYALAILLAEHAARTGAPAPFQVFATDLSDDALAIAREGLYPDTIAADVSEERLARFFEREGGFYRVRPALRERVLFATHSLLRDPPFSRLDLAVCRNLLIYLDRGLQGRVFEAFHYALRPGGVLFLGSAESPEGASDLFTPIRKKLRLYARRELPAGAARMPTLPLAAPATPGLGRRRTPAGAPPALAPVAAGAPALHPNLLDSFAPPSVVVDERHEIVYLSDGAGRYLLHPSGAPTNNAVKLVRAELRADLRAGLHEAFAHGRPWGSRAIPARFDGDPCHVHVLVRPGTEAAGTRGLALVIFSDVEAPADAPAGDGAGADPAVRALEEEAARMKERLQTTVEQYETSNEELMASNEEMQSINEEFKSTLEELETSKEELQSVNEELHTVNAELKGKVDDLAAANGDLHNLMAATDVGTLFLDRALCVKRYTPPALALFNVIPGDHGRPLAHVTHRLRYPGLAADVAAVLGTLVPLAREVEAEDGRWYFMRARPYRTPDDRIDGVVLTFADVTELKLAEAALRESRALFDATLSTISDFAYAFDRDGRFLFANRPLLDLWGMTLEQAAGKRFRDLPYPADLAARLDREVRQVLDTGRGLIGETPYTGPAGAEGFYEYIFRPFVGPDGAVTLVAGSTRDVTERKRAADALRESEERYRLLVDQAREYAILALDAQGCIESWNEGAERILGYAEDEALGKSAEILFTPEDRAAGIPARERATAREAGQALDDRWNVRRDGTRFWASGTLYALHDSNGALRGYAKILRDNTRRKQVEDALRISEERLRLATEASQIGLWDWDVVADTMTWTPYVHALFGIPPEAFDGTAKAFLATVHPDDRAEIERAIDAALRGEEPYRPEFRVVVDAPDERWLACAGEVYRDEHGAPVRMLGVVSDVTARRAADERMRELNVALEGSVAERTEEVRSLVSSLTLAEQDERHRLAHVLHDHLQQLLYGIQMQMQLMRLAPDGERARLALHADHMGKLLDEAILATRTLTSELAPPVLKGPTLRPILHYLALQMEETHTLAVEIDVDDGLLVHGESLRVLLFQLVRELLFNVVKHAHAPGARVAAAERAGRIEVEVRDDGAGFDVEKAARRRSAVGGFGLFNVQDRLRALGGRMTITSTPGAGTIVTVEVPNRPADEA